MINWVYIDDHGGVVNYITSFTMVELFGLQEIEVGQWDLHASAI